MADVTATPSEDGKELTIKVNGRFDFSCHSAFREAYERQNVKPQSITLDLKDTTHLDSSALGMLLLLRDHAGGDAAKVKLENPSAEIRKILAISNFNKLFEIV